MDGSLIRLLRRERRIERHSDRLSQINIIIITVHGQMEEYIRESLDGDAANGPMDLEYIFILRWWRGVQGIDFLS